MVEEKRAKDMTEFLSHCKEVKEIMEIKTIREMINGEKQHLIDSEGNIPKECLNPIVDKKWVAVDDMTKVFVEFVKGVKGTIGCGSTEGQMIRVDVEANKILNSLS